MTSDGSFELDVAGEETGTTVDVQVSQMELVSLLEVTLKHSLRMELITITLWLLILLAIPLRPILFL